MFIGREKELSILEQLYETQTFQFSLLYGRRRVGKTALLSQFTQKKDCIYFTALETNIRQNVNLLQKLLQKYLLPISYSPDVSFEEILDLLFAYSVEKQFVLVLDNVHFLSKAEKNFSSILETLFLKYQNRSHLFLILSGSSMPILEKEFLSDKSILLPYFSYVLHLKPFDFFECRKFFKNISSVDLAYIYGMVGGIPEYLLSINERFSLEENIKHTFFNPCSHIFEEPALLLRQEVREPALYNAILSAIAGGASKLSEIASVIGEETSVCAAYLKTMILLEIVQKEFPVTKDSARKTIYRISDPIYRFWYSFLPELLSEIYQQKPDAAYRQLLPHLQDYMNEVFEEICRQYLISLKEADKTPFIFQQIGRWWGNNPFHKEKLQIPLLATDNDNSYLFGICKWSDQKMDLPELEAFIEQSELFICQYKYYYFFSKSGFSKNAQDAVAGHPDITLVSFSK